MAEHDDQITLLVEQVTAAFGPDSLDSENPDSPQVAIPSILTLTRPMEDRLGSFIDRRLREVCEELGREEVLAASQGDTGAEYGAPVNMQLQQDHGRSFFARRRLHELNYNLKVEWREHVYGGIFAETNYPVPMSRRLVQQQISRAQNYFFATDPWFSAGAEGRSDETVAQEVDRFAKYKGRKARVKNTLCEAIRAGFIRGEGVLKTSFADDRDIYETRAEIAVQNGVWLTADDGDYIYRHDTWSQVPQVDDLGQPIPGTEQWVLDRDQSTLAPNNDPSSLTFAEQKIKRSLPLRRGAIVDLVHFLDFVCPLHAPSVQDADFCAHLYERPALHVASQVLAQNSPDRRSQVLKVLRELRASSPVPSTGQLINRPELGESNERTGAWSDGAAHEPRVKIAECYVRFDVNGDGVEESLFVLWDTENRRLLYYDYLANVTPDGKRPFHVVRVNPVDNRWHGLSQMEVFEDQQKLVDLFLNRVVKATSDQATVKFWRPERTVEGQANPDLLYNDGSTFQPLENFKAADILETVELFEPRIEEMMRLIEFVQQNTLNMSGVAGANDAQAAGLDTAKLATGIRNLDKTGQELFAPYLQSLEEGLASAVEAWIGTELFYLDRAEVYEYFEGDTRMVAELTPDRVRNIAVDVRMELTRYRNEQQDVQLMQSIQLVQQYFTLPPMLQMQLAPLYRQLLKLREIQDADRILQPVDPMMMGGMMGLPPGDEGAPPAAPAPSQPPTPENPVSPVGAAMPGETEDNF